MITYNMRYRGPYEYDKFVLNTFQIHNEIEYLKDKYLHTTLAPYMEKYNKLKEYENKLISADSYLNKLIEINLRME